mgnify:CR=1 FL=1
MSGIKKYIYYYVVLWVISLGCLIYIILDNESEVQSYTLRNYIINYESVIVTIAISYIVSKFYSFSKIKALLANMNDNAKYARTYRRYNTIRLTLILLSEINNIIAYIIVGGASYIYMFAILLVVLLFCIPQTDEQILSKKS